MSVELSGYRRNLYITRRAERIFASENQNPLETFDLEFFERGTYEKLPYWIGPERQAELKTRAEQELLRERKI